MFLQISFLSSKHRNTFVCSLGHTEVLLKQQLKSNNKKENTSLFRFEKLFFLLQMTQEFISYILIIF
jgi:hypothetical protein